MVMRIIILLILCFFHFATSVHAEEPLTAAFIRDHQLWIKKGDREKQITQNQQVSSPEWSFDGRFIAYLSNHEEANQLYIYDTKENTSYKPYVRIETSDFKWSPIKNQLAYTSGGVLNVTKTKNGRPEGFENVSVGVSSFEWFPNGHEFIVSSTAQILPTGWGPIRLFQIPIDANLHPAKIKPFYTIETSDELFAIDTEYFKWSRDGKWVSFLAIPTASLSMDGNYLCVLTSEGEKFHVLGSMLWYEDWMKWAPSANQIAYISGEGRFFVENKNATIADMPASVQQKEYTPKGYVDLDIEWFSPDEVIVARARANKEWEEGPIPTMFTSLYSINIKTEEQKQLTFPKKNERDVHPQVIGTNLTWFRKTERDSRGDVWVKKGLEGKELLWIRNVDTKPVFYLKRKDD